MLKKYNIYYKTWHEKLSKMQRSSKKFSFFKFSAKKNTPILLIPTTKKKISFFFKFVHKFQTKATPIFTHGSKNLFSHIEFTVQISSKSITPNVTFSVFWVILGDIDTKKFSKNLKLCTEFFVTLYIISCEK